MAAALTAGGVALAWHKAWSSAIRQSAIVLSPQGLPVPGSWWWFYIFGSKDCRALPQLVHAHDGWDCARLRLLEAQAEASAGVPGAQQGEPLLLCCRVSGSWSWDLNPGILRGLSARLNV